jgi:hypothetical protein
MNISTLLFPSSKKAYGDRAVGLAAFTGMISRLALQHCTFSTCDLKSPYNCPPKQLTCFLKIEVDDIWNQHFTATLLKMVSISKSKAPSHFQSSGEVRAVPGNLFAPRDLDLLTDSLLTPGG